MRELYNRYGAFVMVFILLFLVFFMLRPYFIPLVTAGIIAYIFYPAYQYILRIVKNRNVASLIALLLVYNLVFVPMLFLLNTLIDQIPSLYIWLTDLIQTNTLSTIALFDNLEKDFGVTVNLAQFVQSVATYVLRYGNDILRSLPSRVLNLTVSALLLFFFFRDGKELFSSLISNLPFNKKDKKILVREGKMMVDAVIYGQVVTAFIQAIMATIGYWLLGVQAPLIWGILSFLFTVVPMIGPAFVYVPVSVFLIFSGGNETIRGIILLVYGVLFVSSIDNVLRPLLISEKVRLHPAIVILGVVGGIQAFGVIGFILGPLIFVLLVTIFHIYQGKQRLHKTSQ